MTCKSHTSPTHDESGGPKDPAPTVVSSASNSPEQEVLYLDGSAAPV